MWSQLRQISLHQLQSQCTSPSLLCLQEIAELQKPVCVHEGISWHHQTNLAVIL